MHTRTHDSLGQTPRSGTVEPKPSGEVTSKCKRPHHENTSPWAVPRWRRCLPGTNLLVEGPHSLLDQAAPSSYNGMRHIHTHKSNKAQGSPSALQRRDFGDEQVSMPGASDIHGVRGGRRSVHPDPIVPPADQVIERLAQYRAGEEAN